MYRPTHGLAGQLGQVLLLLLRLVLLCEESLLPWGWRLKYLGTLCLGGQVGRVLRLQPPLPHRVLLAAPQAPQVLAMLPCVAPSVPPWPQQRALLQAPGPPGSPKTLAHWQAFPPLVAPGLRRGLEGRRRRREVRAGGRKGKGGSRERLTMLLEGYVGGYLGACVVLSLFLVASTVEASSLGGHGGPLVGVVGGLCVGGQGGGGGGEGGGADGLPQSGPSVTEPHLHPGF